MTDRRPSTEPRGDARHPRGWQDRCRRGRRRRRPAWRPRCRRPATAPSVTLLERYPYLGGTRLRRHGAGARRHAQRHLEITVQGIGMEIIERMAAKWDLRRGPARSRPPAGRPPDRGDVAQMVALGLLRFSHIHDEPRIRSSLPPPSIRTAGSGPPTTWSQGGRCRSAPAQLVLLGDRRGRP